MKHKITVRDIFSIILPLCLVVLLFVVILSRNTNDDNRLYSADKNVYYEAEEYDYMPEYEAETAMMPSETGMNMDSSMLVNGSSSDLFTSAARQNDAKIIYTVSLEMETKKFDETAKNIDALILENEGYCENQYVSNGNGQYRTANYTIRIPVDNLDKFLNKTEELSTVVSIHKSADDVSEYYYDTESRLETAQIKLARLQELLAEAEDISDMITIEEAITDIEWEIDNYSGTLKHYDSQIEYSTVSLYLREVYETSDIATPLTFGERVASAFEQGMHGFITALKNIAIWFIANWLWIAIAVIVVIVIIVLIKKHNKKVAIANKENRKMQEKEEEKIETEDVKDTAE